MKFALVFIAAVIGLGMANTCGGNCPNNDCPSCPCGDTVTYIDIAQLCARYSEWNQKCCQCIVYHESNGDINNVNYNTDGTYDVGVFQINQVNWACNGGEKPCAVDPNLKCAIEIWRESGGNFHQWSTSHEYCGGC
jgi:hypothetical protein